jgi:hypothetical protein
MTTITLEVSDELAARLTPLQGKLPGLLAEALALRQVDGLAQAESGLAMYPAYQETLNFLTSCPTPDRIVAFKASPATQERLEELLDKRRETGLTEEEEAELDAYEQVNDLMILLKAHARTVQPRTN